MINSRQARRGQAVKIPQSDLSSKVLLDDNLMELTKGKPFPLKHRAKLLFHKAITNDAAFLSVVNIIDYSIIIGIDEETHEIVGGIVP